MYSLCKILFDLVFAFTILLASGVAVAQQALTRQLVLLGGSGDLPGPSQNIFTESFINSISTFGQSGYRVDAAFDGAHPDARDAVKAATGQTFPQFTQAEASKLLAKLGANPGKGVKPLGAGDQVLIMLNSHGEKKSTGQANHCIAVQGGSCWSVEQLRQVRDSLTKRGVQVAVVDLSCYSGSTLNLADDGKTCVIAAANETTPAISTFINAFTSPQRMYGQDPPQNLEELFFQAMDRDNLPISFPSISTPLGQKLRNLESTLASVPNATSAFSLRQAGGLQGELVTAIRANEGFDGPSQYRNSCLTLGAFAPVLKLAQDVGDSLHQRLAQELIDQVKTYNKTLTLIDEQIKDLNTTLNLPNLKYEGRTINAHYLENGFSMESEFQWLEGQLQYCEQSKLGNCQSYRDELDTARWVSKEGHREELLEIFPKYQERASALLKKEELTSRLTQTARDIMEKYRRLALFMYREEKRMPNRPQNACSNFKLQGYQI